MHYFDDLQKLQKMYARLLEPVCRKWDMTRNELDVLLFLYNNPHMDRAADIVAYRGISKGHVSASVAALEQRGYLAKRADVSDRRAVRLVLTEAALPAAVAGKSAQQSLAQLLLRGLDEDELALWQKIAEKIRNNIENSEEA